MSVKSVGSSMTLILNSSITHVLNGTQIAPVLISSGPWNFTISSDSQSTPAHVVCTDKGSGIFFKNFYSITIQNINIEHCGAHLNASVLNFSSETKLVFDSNSFATLMFSQCQYLNVSRLTIFDYKGFALLSMDTVEATFKLVNVSQPDNAKHYSYAGSGLMAMYINPQLYINSSANLTIMNCTFNNNTNHVSFKEKHKCQTQVHKSEMGKQMLKVSYAAGLTIFYNQPQNVSVKASISHSLFIHNRGPYAAAMLVMHMNANTLSSTSIYGAVFKENSIEGHCHGSSLIFYTFFHQNYTAPSDHHKYKTKKLLAVHNSTFVGNTGTGAVFLAVDNQPPDHHYIHVLFSNVFFMDNLGNLSGVCMYASTYNRQNSDYSGFSVVLESIKGWSQCGPVCVE